VRKFLPPIVALLVSLMLVACGGGSGSNAVPTAPNAPASVAFTMTGFPLEGQPGTFSVAIAVKNANGDAISGTLASPLTLTDSDSTGVVKISPATVTMGASTATITFSGAKLAGPVTIGATIAAGSIAVTPLTFAPNADSPFTNGTSAAYTSTDTISDISPAGPPSVNTTTYTETISTGASFNGLSNLIDDRYNYPLVAPFVGTDTFDVYLQYVSGGNGATVSEAGSSFNFNQTSPSPPYTRVDTVAYASPYLTIDMLPHQNGQTWSERQAYKEQEAHNNMNDFSAAYNADGSGTQTSTWSATNWDTMTVNADGSIANTLVNGTFTETSSYSVPTTIGGQQVIVYTDQAGGNPTVTINIPDWYPNGASAPIEKANAVDKGSTAVPAQCNVPASIATTAEDIHIDRLSVSGGNGYYRTTAEDEYIAPNVGLVCDISTEIQWNYNSVTDGKLNLEGQEVTVTSMTSGGFGPQSVHRKNMSAAGAPFAGFGLGLPALIHRVQLERENLHASRQ